MDEFIKNLELIGLRKREIKVLTTLHVFGELSVTKLAGRAKLPRTTTEAILRRLNERGYVRRVPSGKRHLWKAAQVDKIKNRTDTAFDAIQSKLDPDFMGPILESINAKDIGIQVFRGKKQVQQAYKALAPQGGTLLGVQGSGFVKYFLSNIFEEEEQSSFHALLIERGVVVEAFVPESTIEAYLESDIPASFWEKAFAVPYRMHTVPDKLIPFDSEIVMFADRVMITTPKDKMVVFIQYEPFVKVVESFLALIRAQASQVDTFELKRKLLEQTRG